jgi:methionyl-tRNA formyltransferase
VEAGGQNTEAAIAYEIWSSVIAENTRNSGGLTKSTVFVPDPKSNRDNNPGLDDGKSTTSRLVNNISGVHQMLYEKGQEMLLKKTKMMVTQKLKKEMSIEKEANFKPKINKWRSKKTGQDPGSTDYDKYLHVEDRLLAWAHRKNQKLTKKRAFQETMANQELLKRPKVNDLSLKIINETSG